jgi:hypothetical protein
MRSMKGGQGGGKCGLSTSIGEFMEIYEYMWTTGGAHRIGTGRVLRTRSDEDTGKNSETTRTKHCLGMYVRMMSVPDGIHGKGI